MYVVLKKHFFSFYQRELFFVNIIRSVKTYKNFTHAYQEGNK
jgi:hypothetical protein